MQHERQKCPKDVCQWLANRPNRLVEKSGDRSNSATNIFQIGRYHCEYCLKKFGYKTPATNSRNLEEPYWLEPTETHIRFDSERERFFFVFYFIE